MLNPRPPVDGAVDSADAGSMERVGILTSGGDAPGMNAAIWAVIKLAAARNIEVIGVERGYDGLIDGTFRTLTRLTSTGTLAPEYGLEWLAGSGGTLLGSSRCPRFLEAAGRAQACRKMSDTGVGGLIVVGGNGSLAGAHALSAECSIPVVGLPASIDNDIGGTDTAIGVDTALNTIIEACDRIADTARSHHRAFILEVMGRRSGFLAIAAAVAITADAVLVPENPKSETEILDGVEQLVRHSFSPEREKRRVIVLKAEGVEASCTSLAEALEGRLDDLADVSVRAMVLGHIVRGGRPSYRDRMIAGRLAMGAVGGLLAGADDVMIGWDSPVGDPTVDGNVFTVPLTTVMAETAAMLDGTSEVVRNRMALFSSIEGVLAL
jgi:6-phosphofructokinase 1